METYAQMKSRHQAEMNALPFGFAFGDESFDRMMGKWGLTSSPEDCEKIVSFGAGIFLQKKDIPAYREVSDRHARERKETLRGDVLKKALISEMHNHECQYGDFADALRALGLDEKTLTPEERKIYKTAQKEFWDYCVKNDCF